LVTHNFVNIASTPVLRQEIKAEWRGHMSKTFLLGAELTDLGGFGRYLGPKQGKSKCFQRIREIS
jgi:hypothetical protein